MPSKDNEETEDKSDTTQVIGNEILFYGEVSVENILEFIEKFKKLEIDLLKRSADLIDYSPVIRLHIMSEGGDIFSGMNAMNVIERSRVKVITIAQGACCSAATFMLMGGHERRIGQNAYVLIHQLSTEIWGKFHEIKDELKSCKKFMKCIKDLFMSKTEIPEKKFDKLMKKDLYLDARKCIKYKIVPRNRLICVYLIYNPIIQNIIKIIESVFKFIGTSVTSGGLSRSILP